MARAPQLPFDLSSLEVFLTVCETGAMTAAARQLGLTQPAVSQTIQLIEIQSGISLFDRGARPLTLTPSGILLRQRASALLAEARQMIPALRGARGAPLALLRVGLVDSLSRSVAPGLARFLMGHAEQISIQSGLTSAHTASLLSRQLDIMAAVDELDELPGLERWPLLDEPYILISPASEKSDKLEALLARLPMARFSERSRSGTDVERYLRRVKAEAPRRIEFDGPHGVAAMVADGAAFAITTPLCLIEADADWSRIRCGPLPGPQAARRLVLIAREAEFGRLPQIIAAEIQTLLLANCLPSVKRRMPWAVAAWKPGGSRTKG
jgi:DNA-binding transcriptional LysR family regulator